MSKENGNNLTTDARNGVLTITFHRPEKLNAITVDMRKEIETAIDRFADDPDLLVLLFRAEGRYFSAGMDITGMGKMPSESRALRRHYRQLHTIFDKLEIVEKPVVLAAQGPCLGGALEMALSCDFRLASEEAAFGLPEIRIGVLPGSGGTSRLTRLVGTGWARWFIMTGKSIPAKDALRIGLVQEVWPAETFDTEVTAFIDLLKSMPPEALGSAKLAIDLCSELGREQSRNVERLANTILINSDGHKQAVEAFRQRSKSRTK
jgi:enoyl-CoA hydratase/carnithine racemase